MAMPKTEQEFIEMLGKTADALDMLAVGCRHIADDLKNRNPSYKATLQSVLSTASSFKQLGVDVFKKCMMEMFSARP